MPTCPEPRPTSILVFFLGASTYSKLTYLRIIFIFIQKVFAVVGTVFNILAVGGLLYVILSTGVMGAMYGTSFVQFLVFTSVISAVDPVAVLVRNYFYFYFLL